MNSDSKSERVTQFRDLRVSEKTSGKHLFKRDGLIVFTESTDDSFSSVTVEEAVNVIEKVSTLTEDTLRVEGTVVILKRSSSKSLHPAPTFYQFEACVPAAISEDS